MTNQPKISVIMPVYNSELFLDRAISSVLNQKYDHLQLVMVDDASSDNSWAKLQEWKKEHPTKIVIDRLETNMGASFARNLAIQQADGEYLTFLDSDDYWHADKLPNQIDYMLSRELSFCFSDYELQKPDGTILPKIAVSDEVDFDLLLEENQFSPACVLLKRDAFEKIEFPLIKRRNDWALWLSLTKSGQKAIRYPYTTVTVVSRKNSLSLSANRLEYKLWMLITYRWKVYQLFEVHPMKRIRLIVGFVTKEYRKKVLHLFALISKPFKKAR